MKSIKNKYTTWTNQEKIHHLNEVKTEYQENCDKVREITNKSSGLLNEISTLEAEIIWD